LVDAFKATLEEAVVADLLIHVLDVSNPEFEDQYHTTLRVLKEIGADKNPTLIVFNKTDAEREDSLLLRDRAQLLAPGALYVSAKTGFGTDALKEAISDALNAKLKTVKLMIPHARYDVISKLHSSGGIREQETQNEGVLVVGQFPEILAGLIRPFEVD
ncbi:MAG: GTPase HflX, partial [Verrucomicrobiota bacterium]